MHFDQIDEIPDEIWSRAVPIVLAQIRAEKGDPTWLPKLHNGSYEFSARMLNYIKGQGWWPST